jgi:predicted acyl esterase
MTEPLRVESLRTMRVDVTSSSFPRVSRSLDDGEDVGTSTRMVVAEQTVLHTDRSPSHVLLPVLPT